MFQLSFKIQPARSYKTARASQIPTNVEEDSESLVSYQKNNSKTCAPMAVSEREEEEDCKEQQSAYYGRRFKDLKIEEGINGTRRLEETKINRLGGNMLENIIH
ncbi:hypothetical protein Tco_1169484 [Tanacetum coccineum]